MFRNVLFIRRCVHAQSILKIESDLNVAQIVCMRRYASDHAKQQPPRDNQLVQSTKKWIDLVVVGEKLCPFAPPLISSNTIRIVASAAQCATDATNDIRVEVDLLLRPTVHSSEKSVHSDTEISTSACDQAMKFEEKDANVPLHETTLIVFDGNFVRDFHDFVRLSWILQSDAVVAGGYVDDVQLVLFHPTAKHQTYGTDDQDGNAADFTIRSPYPLVHLLREVDVMRAVSGSYPNLEDLPSRNKQKMLAQGFSVCKNRLLDCYKAKAP
jgi:uncharacterized protein